MNVFAVPSSKSISNRLLVLKYLSGCEDEIKNISCSDDTILMQKHLNNISSGNNYLFCDNAGTVVRFLVAVCALKEGVRTIDGDLNMRQRPIKPLVDVLIELGAEIKYLEKEGFLPLEITGGRLKGGKEINIDCSLSSQFLSAVLLISNYIEGGIKINVSDEIVSKPYVDITISLMKNPKWEVEADWSCAAFGYEIVAITKKEELFIPLLNRNSIQGDKIAEHYFRMLGVQTEYSEEGAIISYNSKLIEKEKKLVFDFKDCPDLYPCIALTCFYNGIDAQFINVESLKYKESNRLEAMEYNINLLRNNIFNIRTFDDHRIAMAFGVLSKMEKTLRLDNYECVSKSFPLFWEMM